MALRPWRVTKIEQDKDPAIVTSEAIGALIVLAEHTAAGGASTLLDMLGRIRLVELAADRLAMRLWSRPALTATPGGRSQTRSAYRARPLKNASDANSTH